MAKIGQRLGGFLAFEVDEESGDFGIIGSGGNIDEVRQAAVDHLKEHNSPTISVFLMPVLEALTLDEPVEDDGETEGLDEIIARAT